MKPPLLLLCHRIPFPPNKGDKIRTYHLLKYLVSHYEVHLGAFIDDPDDWQYVTEVESLCATAHFVSLEPKRSTLFSAIGLLTGEALSLPYYRSRSLTSWVKSTLAQYSIDKAMAVSSPMAQFLSSSSLHLTTKVIDLVDIDSDKWAQYAQMKPWPLSWVYQREAVKLFAYEQRIAQTFDVSFFVSSAEAQLFVEKAPITETAVSYYNNGVDSHYFSPHQVERNPYPESVPVLVFTGAMDYWPNVDAVEWFVTDVFPLIRKKHPRIEFYIVGGKPTDAVVRLQKVDGVKVTGRVADVRPYIKFATAVVAPMRVARGVQNKVLEAMAMEKHVIVTEKGLEGINAENGYEVLVADTAQDFSRCIDLVMAKALQDMGIQARQRVTEDFNWANTLPVIRQYLDQTAELIPS
ncbi:TIGR03087 family PEP-CTERM/XrtA system glycosyltransferase [Neptunomonas phycophila]|uniref:TIGR03087 family PEP-CTERM/XrtA system glycosyltransferase n=1 Tax=Neptunomonas phycophila TaxID=1572645 RepID=A0AAW7XK91_9GAMM|nr:TIGR03087 family PEP-CTERM/XrtA system glycosyltransferase [Neptunomonas phycophila]MDO6454490.1 TIGR03087 family PEP-CTERM/XrtA system glycosyltransferase [Neptunomonas phycophila]